MPAINNTFKHVQSYISTFIEHLINAESKNYDNTLVPFSEYATNLRFKTEKVLTTMFEKLQDGKRILKEHFLVGEKQNPKINPEAKYAVFEEALNKIAVLIKNQELARSTKPLQEVLGLSWAFMDRAYQTGKSLLCDKRYDEAEALYTLLSFLNPEVYEYWLCAAAAQQGVGKIQEAIDTYTTTLQLQPQNPLVLFQLASCYYEAKQKEECVEMLSQTIEYVKEKPEYEALYKEAQEVNKILQIQGVA